MKKSEWQLFFWRAAAKYTPTLVSKRDSPAQITLSAMFDENTRASSNTRILRVNVIFHSCDNTRERERELLQDLICDTVICSLIDLGYFHILSRWCSPVSKVLSHLTAVINLTMWSWGKVWLGGNCQLSIRLVTISRYHGSRMHPH